VLPYPAWSGQKISKCPRLPVPATSASVERFFGVAGATIRAMDSSLAAATVESLLLHSELSD